MKTEGFEINILKKIYKRMKKHSKCFSSLIIRDVLDYLDYEINLNKNLEELIFEVNQSMYHPQKPYMHLSPKNKGINRPTVIFDIKDALVYRFKNSVDGDFYEKWIKQWKEFISSRYIFIKTKLLNYINQ